MRIPFVLLLALCAPACSGPPAPQSIEGEPVCPDFEVGATRTKMQGGLRFPVTLVIKEKETVLSRTTLKGLRTDSDPKTRVLLRDEDAEFTLEWAQCENERAPSAPGGGRGSKDAAAYECGTPTSYKTEQLISRKGDPSSRVIHFAEPPNLACWIPETPAATQVADAGVADASSDDASPANAPDPDAGVDAASTDAAAPPEDSGLPTDSGPPLDGGPSAGTKKKKTKAPPPK